MPRHYFDAASTSPLRPIARVAMQQSLDVPAADPGRMHAEGLTVRHQLELARTSVADFLGARPREVIFTSSATEAITMAIWGQTEQTPGLVIFSAAEHSAVRLTAERTAHRMVPIDRFGCVDPLAIAQTIDDERAAGNEVSLVVSQIGNHEVGALQDIQAVSQLCAERGVALLIDGAQAIGRVDFDFKASGASFAAVSGHKLGGPAGSGALLVKRGLRVEPLFVGGAQERARRAGLENTVAAVGLGAACAELTDVWAAEAASARQATDRLRQMFASIDNVEVFGPTDAALRLPHLVCVGLTDVEPQAIVIALDQAGVAAHSGSACASEDFEPSPVLAAMGVPADHSLRLSVGWQTTTADVDAACTAIPRAIASLRALRT